MKKWILALLAVVVLVTVIFFIGITGRGPKLKDFEYLRNPRIVEKPSQNMLIVELKGDPALAGKKAFTKLFNVYFNVMRGVKSYTFQGPRARWPKDFNTPKEEWVGVYGFPLPEFINALPPQDPNDPVQVKLRTWKYGYVAEILHVGPYGEEAPTVEKLRAFITDNGYEIAGDHEEEYLKGPGMILRGNPKKYFTILRYEIKKKGAKK